MKMFRLLALAALGGVQLLAVPAWSRLTGSSCATCHAVPTWQLNSYGLEFLKNGHRTEATKVEAKDQKLENYISLVWKGRAYGDTLDTARTGNTTTQKPYSQIEQHSFSLYTGGALSDRVSYFTELYLSENAGQTNGAYVTSQSEAGRKKLAEAFLQYNQPLGKDMFLSVRMGEILPGILHVFGVGARSAEQRAVVLNDPLAAPQNVPSNTFRPFSRQSGIDTTLNMKQFEFSVGVVNGSNTSVTNAIDADNHKDWFASALWNFDKNNSAVGFYHYDGQYSNYATKDDFSTALTFDNKFKKDGLLARYIYGMGRVVGAYFVGEETMNLAGTKTKNKGYYLLSDFNVNEFFGVYGRYDFVDPNKDLAMNEVKQILLGFNGLLFQSDKSGARWNLELSQKKTGNGNISTVGTTEYTDKRAFFQITWGF